MGNSHVAKVGKMKNLLKLGIAIVFLNLLAGNTMADLNDGLIAYYPFDGNAQDASGNGNHGVVHGATLTEDRFGNSNSAYNFNGINNYIEALTHFSYSTFTINLWIYLNNYRCYGGIVDGYHNQWEVAMNCPSGNKLEFAQWKIGGNYNDHTSSQSLSLQSWYHITIAIDGINGTFYLNGLKDSSFTMSALPLTGIEKFIIGASLSGLPQYFEGIIDDLRIYNRVLSDCEIEKLHFGKVSCNALLVNLDYLKVSPNGHSIRIEWKTTEEKESARFRLWRFDKIGDGKYISPTLITEQPAKGKSSLYSYEDWEVEPEKIYTYRLSEIEMNGEEVFYLDNSAEATTQ